MTKNFFLLVLCLTLPSVYLSVSAQAPGDAFKNLASLPLQTPQAAALSRYVEYPVSYYNGLAQVSIPIYEIVSGDISVPIALSYHGGGIKVQEEASWVGLGWTLNAGGVIIHDVKGGNDEVGINQAFNAVYPNTQLNTYIETPFATGKTGCSMYTNTGALWNCASLMSLLGNVDGEPDMYAYNFGNYSGKFFSGSGQFVDVSHNNIKFAQSAGGFTAITPDGCTYEFLAVEKAWSYPRTTSVNTAYYLTKITSPKGKTVTFQYKSFKQLIDLNGLSWSNQYPNINYAWGPEQTVMQFPSLTENFSNYEMLSTNSYPYPTPPSGVSGLHQAYSSTTSTTLYLDKIVFDIGWVDFIKSPRTDLYGVKLDAINVSRGPLVKSIPFTYNYFVSSGIGDDMYNPNKVGLFLDQPVDGHVIEYPSSYRNRRLKLTSVTVEGNSAHNFEYYENSNLPYKTSFAQDYWGYYNGKNNPSLIPDYTLYSQQRTLSSRLSSWIGADRNPDDNYIRMGSLKKIIYPTGGFSQFNYEMNEWNNLSPEQMTSYRKVTYGDVDAGVGNKKIYFTISTNTYCDIWGGLYCNEMLDMNSSSYNCGCYTCSGGGPNALYAVIEKADPNTHAIIGSTQWQFDILNNTVKSANGSIYQTNQLFAPGTYCMTINYPDNHTPPGNIPYNRRAELYISYYEPIAGQTNNKATGAGLRINSIQQIDPVAMQSLVRNFTYSGGKIMRYPAFNSDAKQLYSIWGSNATATADYRFYYLYSTPAFPLSTSANGCAVGYDMVTESIVGSSSIGKTQYEYKNRSDVATSQPDVYMPGLPTTGYLDNGFLKRVAVYDKDNILVKESINDQLTILSATYWPFKTRFAADNPSDTRLDLINLQVSTFYPVQVGKVLNFTTTNKDYANGTTLTNTKTYSYNSNGLLSQESTTSSDGSSVINSYSYASDYTGVSTGWIKDLRDRNMIGIPLEIYNKRNGLVAGGTFSTYLTHDNIITPDKLYQVETSAPKTIASTVPNGIIPADLKLFGTVSYDASGNLVQSRAENNVYTSYLWGYNKAYPVSKVVGVDYATINNLITNGTVSAAILANPNVSDADMRLQLSNLRTALGTTKSLINTYTYAPLIGITSQTDEKGLITYYSYDSYNRLASIKDYQNKILKQYEYYYSPSIKTAGNNLPYNQEITKYFSKSCSPDQFGRTQISNDVPYTVPANKYVGATQQLANAAATAEINANGQANADALGNCYLYAGPLELTSIENGLGTEVIVRYKCSFFADYYCWLFIQDVATGMYVGGSGGPITLPRDKTAYTILNVPKGKQYKFWLQAQGSSYFETSLQTTILLP